MFTRDQILQLFLALNEDMARRNISASLLVCGGALMALSYNKERVTEDIDALYQPKEEIEEVVRKFADKRGLPDNWLNDAVNGYLKLAVIEPVPILTFSHLEVKGVPEELLLSMKLVAGRQKDEKDIILLLTRKGQFDEEELISDAQNYMPKDLFIGKKYMLRSLIQQYPPRELAKRHYETHYKNEYLIDALTQYTIDFTWPRCLSAQEIIETEMETEYQENAKNYIVMLLEDEKREKTT